MLSKFDYVKPQTLEEALDYLNKNPNTKILAGGTDLMVLLRRNVQSCEHILDIKGIPEMKKLEYIEGEGLFIGASVTVNQISELNLLKEKYPALVHAADTLASYQLRNRATLVGNICNASPGADLSAPLLVYSAKVHIASAEGQRTIDIDKFFTGVKKTVLQSNEIVTGISLSDIEDKDDSIYLKQARIKGHDLAICGVAVRMTPTREVLIAMSAVAPTPIRLVELEKAIVQKGLTSETVNWVAKEAAKYINPISDVRSSAEYRLHVSGVLAKRGLIKLMEKGAN